MATEAEYGRWMREGNYEKWAEARRELHPEKPHVAEPVFQIMLEGQRATLDRARRLLSDDEEEVYEWDRRLSRDERERFARLLLGAMGVAEEGGRS